jgi:hypothetical protein
MKTKTTKYVVQFRADIKGAYMAFMDDATYDYKRDASDHFRDLKAVDPSTRVIKRTVTIDEVIVS